MKEKAINFFNKIKEMWKNLAPKIKKIIMIIAIVVLAMIIISSVLFTTNKDDMVVLYKSMGASETQEVYSQIVRMGVEVDKDSETEELMVRESMKEEIILILAERGYPKTGSPFDELGSESSLTTTDHERKQNDKKGLERDIESTLQHMGGVQAVDVILNIADDNAFAWTDEPTSSTASVNITMMPGYTISPSNVSTVQNLVASSVRNMASESVTVVDAATMLEVVSDENNIDGGGAYEQQFGFGKEVASEFERKVKDLFIDTYGPDGIRVSASVEIDYDKVITENNDYIADNNGRGVLVGESESYDMEANQLADGVAGEENNTDIPIIVDEDDDGVANYVNHTRDSEYLVSSYKRQVEKNGYPVKKATISVIVQDANLDDEKKEAIIDAISKAVNIEETNIAVNSFIPQGQEEAEPTGTGNELLDLIAENPIMIVAIGIGLLVLIIIIAIIAAIFRRRSKVKKEKFIAQQQQDDDSEAQETIRKAQGELDEHKRKLKEMSELSTLSSTKENAVAEEIRNFSDQSPEITASLIRAWLREDD